MNLTKAILSFLALSMVATAQAESNTPTKVQTQFGHVYIIEGFDNNDNVQIVGEGYFPNSCYRNADVMINVDHETKTIQLNPLAYKYPGICLQVIMPFDRVAEVGVLKAGQYRVVQQGDNRVLGEVKINATASKEPDDQMYAPISQAYVRSMFTGNVVYLTGDFPLSCMKLKEVKIDTQSDVLVVRPIAEINNSVPCQKGRFPFEVATDLKRVNSGRYLLHVRSMNGKSVNNLVNVR